MTRPEEGRSEVLEAPGGAGAYHETPCYNTWAFHDLPELPGGPVPVAVASEIM